MQEEKSKQSSNSSFSKELKRYMAQPTKEIQLQFKSHPSSNSDLFERMARSSEGRLPASDRVSDDRMSLEEEPSRQLAKQHQKSQNVHNCVCQVFGDCLGVNCNCFLSQLPCTPQCCPTCIVLKNSRPKEDQQRNPCACKKTRCLMRYCQCLANNKYCTAMCLCQFCQNHQSSQQRKQIIQELVQRQPERFIGLKEQKNKGCKCRKTHCDKKYCSCFSDKVSCSQACKCTTCNNNKVLPKKQEPLQQQRLFREKAFQKQYADMAPNFEFTF